MTDLVTIRVQQARVHARTGNLAKAIELLEQARVLARGDKGVVVPVLRQLIEWHRLAGNSDRADLLCEELAGLAPGESLEAAAVLLDGEVLRRPPRGLSRSAKIGLIALSGAVVCAVVVFVWWMAGNRYEPTPIGSAASPVSPAAAAPAQVIPTATGTQSPGPPPVGAAPGSLARAVSQQARPGIPLPGGTPANQPAFASNTPAASMPAPDRDRAELVRENVGLLVHVARYQGTVGGRICRLEIPLKGGSCFAIGRNGIVLTNKHVTSIERDAVPEDCTDLGLPTLTRRELAMVACFGPDASQHCPAAVVHESTRYDLASLKVDRQFDHPPALAGSIPPTGEQVYACGSPAAVTEFLNQMSSDDVRARVRQEAAGGSVFFTSLLARDVFEPAVVGGTISGQQRIGGASYLQFDAKIAPGSSGGPLLNQQDEVVGVLTLSASDAGHEAPNFALALPQVRSEIDTLLKN